MNHIRRLLLKCELFLIPVILLSACYASETAPQPIPNDYRIITVGNIKLSVDVREMPEINKQYAQERSEEGFHFTEVKVTVQPYTLPTGISLADAMTKIMNWQVFLKDPLGKHYMPKYRNWGLVVGDVTTVDWIFVMPNQVRVVWLTLPEGVSTDLTHIVESGAMPTKKATPVTGSATATVSSISPSIQQARLSMADEYYEIEATVRNSFAYDIAVKGLSMRGVKEWPGLCAGTSPIAQTFFDRFSIAATGGSNLQFQGLVTDEAQQDYKYPLEGSSSNGCGLQELKLDFGASFAMPAARLSSFRLVFPRYLKLKGSSSTVKLPLLVANLDDGKYTSQFDKLTFAIHTDQDGTISANVLLEPHR